MSVSDAGVRTAGEIAAVQAQASWCGDPDAGPAFTESALVRANRLTATARAMVHNSRARDLAKLGEVQDALSAIGAADEEFSHARPVEDASWMARFVAETRNRLTAGIAARVDGRARTRDQIRLASLIMATGDPIEAAALGTQALDWAGPYTPRRRRPARTTPVTVDENCPILYRPPPKPDPLPPPARAVDPDEPPPF